MIEAISATPDGAHIRLLAPETAPVCAIGDSVAIDGCCLTVVSAGDGALEFVAVAETLRRTTLGDLSAGDRVNVEPAMRMGDRLGGHWVQGHVDGVGEVAAIAPDGDGVRVTFSAPEAVARYTIEKGSVTVAGVSLTVAAYDDHGFTVALIPHTAEMTTLGTKRPGDPVNIEVDVIAKYVELLVQPYATGHLATPPSVRYPGEAG